MRLVPPQILNCNSAAERKVFDFLKEISFSPYDVALHSLNIGKHEYKRWGEADFFIISKRGILLLEVKGGRVACKNGVWEFTNRYGETNQKGESPAAQAGSAYFSLEKEYLNKTLYKELGGVPRGWGVVFTDIPRLTSERSSPLPEHPDEITAYEGDCRGHNTFKAYLERAFDHWQSCQARPRELTPEVVNRIASFLRPNFERVPSLDLQLRNLRRDLCEFTEEQYERLDEIEENDRIMVSGGAGTGKTFLAAACTRYEAASGKKVLAVTRSPFLASYLASLDIQGDVTVATIEEVEQLSQSKAAWDCLIIDEGQDLCDPASIDTLDAALVGGLETGRWRWFGDPNHQVSNSYPIDEVSYEYLRDLTFKRKLKQNIRNAGRVVEAIRLFTGADIGNPKGRPEGGSFKILTANETGDEMPKILATLKGWLVGDGAATRSDVAVLIGDDADAAAVAKELSSKGYRAEALSKRAMGSKQRDCVLVARIEDFKGLERPLVCLAGLQGETERLVSCAYKAMSRANHHLVIVTDEETAKALAENAAALPQVQREEDNGGF